MPTQIDWATVMADTPTLAYSTQEHLTDPLSADKPAEFSLKGGGINWHSTLLRVDPFNRNFQCCLVCHNAVFNMAIHCPEQPCPEKYVVTAVNNPDIVNSALARPIPQSVEARSLRELVLYFSYWRAYRAEGPLYMVRRDNLFREMLEAMENSEVEELRGRLRKDWLTVVSAFAHLILMFHTYCQFETLQLFRGVFTDEEDEALEVLNRVATFDVKGTVCTELLKSFRTVLRTHQANFKEVFAIWHANVQIYLDSCEEVRALDPPTALWLRKAYTVVVRSQAKFVLDDQFIARWAFPNTEDVVREEEFNIWELSLK